MKSKIPEHSEENESQNLSTNHNRSFFNRTFGRIEPGSIRGNLFLLMVITIGSSFFVLPHLARQIGLLFTVLLVLFSGFLSYMCSKILYIGFQETDAKTYNECMERLLGKKVGFLSTLVIMMHTFGATISSWIFSWIYLSNGLLQFMQIDPDVTPINIWYQHSYFIVCFAIIFTVTLFRSIEKLKIVSMVGFCMIIYLIVVCVSLTPKYFEYYNSKNMIIPTYFTPNIYALKGWGITNYMFLNQYAIMPICKTTKDVSFSRITKIIKRCIITVGIIYLAVLFCGYYSLPTNIHNEIFLLRKPLEGDPDYFIMYGKILFGIALFVGVMIKSHFLLIYFDQMIEKFKQVFGRTNDDEYKTLEDNLQDKEKSIEAEESGETETMNPKTTLMVWKPKAIIRNLLFLAFACVLGTLGVQYLVKILGFIGSFVGVFELIIIPGCMFLVIDQKRRYMGQFTRKAFVFGVVFLTLVSILAVITNFIVK